MRIEKFGEYRLTLLRGIQLPHFISFPLSTRSLLMTLGTVPR